MKPKHLNLTIFHHQAMPRQVGKGMASEWSRLQVIYKCLRVVAPQTTDLLHFEGFSLPDLLFLLLSLLKSPKSNLLQSQWVSDSHA